MQDNMDELNEEQLRAEIMRLRAEIDQVAVEDMAIKLEPKSRYRLLTRFYGVEIPLFYVGDHTLSKSDWGLKILIEGEKLKFVPTACHEIRQGKVIRLSDLMAAVNRVQAGEEKDSESDG